MHATHSVHRSTADDEDSVSQERLCSAKPRGG